MIWEIVVGIILVMQVVYGFIYYFILALIISTFLLSLFAFKKLRKHFFSFVARRSEIFENQILQLVIYVSFALIAIIFI